MNIRQGETDRVPETTPCLLVWDDFSFEATGSSKGDIRRLYGHLTGPRPPKLVFAMWRGEWRTDAFPMDQAILRERLQKWAANNNVFL